VPDEFGNTIDILLNLCKNDKSGSLTCTEEGETMMTAKRVALFMLSLAVGASCALDTEGQGNDEEDQVPDIVPDEATPDVSEVDTTEVVEEDAGEESRDETDDESEPDEVEPDETTDAPDAEAAEDVAEAEDESGEEDGDAIDGEAIDPCTPPEIPTTGRIWLFYCLAEEGPTEMVMWRWIRREWAPYVLWEREPGCSRASTTSLWCEVEYYHTAIFYFNIEMPGLGIGWSCGPALSAPYGTPRVWLDGLEIPVSAESNGMGGCNHVFSTP
jgi:hypothetical protein